MDSNPNRHRKQAPHPQLAAVQETARLREICGLTTEPDAVNFTRRELLVLVIGCMAWLRTVTDDPREIELCEDWQISAEWVYDAMGQLVRGVYVWIRGRWVSRTGCPAAVAAMD